MTKLIKIQIENPVFNETINDSDLTIIHSDYLLNNEDSQTESDVTKLLKSLPLELQYTAINESGFYLISESKIYEYIKYNVLSESGIVEGNFYENQKHFLNELYPSFEKHFPNTFNDDFEVINSEVIGNIANFATKKLIEDSRIEINNEKVIIDSNAPNNYSSNVHNVNWIEEYVNSLK